MFVYNKGFYNSKRRINPRSSLDKYDAFYCFGLGFLLCQIVGGVAALLSSTLGSAATIQFTLIAFVLIYMKYNAFPLSNIKIKKTKPLNYAIAAVIGISVLFVNLPLINVFIELLDSSGLGSGGANIQYGSGVFEKIAAIIVIGVLPAFGEELLLRGVVANGLASKGKWFAIIVSAVLFALMHGNPAQFLHPFIMGVIMAFSLFQTGSLIPAMIIHCVNNTASVVIDMTMGASFDSFYLEYQWLLFGVGLALVVGAVVAMCLYNKHNKENAGQEEALSEKETSEPSDSSQTLTNNQAAIARALIQKEDRRKRLSMIIFVIALALCVASIALVLFAPDLLNV